jgi:hypothetical protein
MFSLYVRYYFCLLMRSKVTKFHIDLGIVMAVLVSREVFVFNSVFITTLVPLQLSQNNIQVCFRSFPNNFHCLYLNL